MKNTYSKNILFIFINFIFLTSIYANTIELTQTPKTNAMIPSAPRINAKSYILIDANSKQILAEKNAKSLFPPASLTKVMTMYVAQEALKNKQISLDDNVFVSKKSWGAEGSRMFLKQGSTVTLMDIFKGIAIDSGNDAAIAIAEHIAGSEDSFVEMMNKTAKNIGMNNTIFTNATGLPNPKLHTSATDLAILATNVIDESNDILNLYKQKTFTYNKIKQNNRNKMLWLNPEVDGLKTGHTSDAGYCLITTLKHNNMRLISVVLGAPSDNARISGTQSLMNWATRFFDTKLIAKKGSVVTNSRVYGGQENYTNLTVGQNLYATLPTDQFKKITIDTNIDSNIKSPIIKNQKYGHIKVSIGDATIKSLPLTALHNNPDGSYFKQAKDNVALYWNSTFS